MKTKFYAIKRNRKSGITRRYIGNAMVDNDRICRSAMIRLWKVANTYFTKHSGEYIEIESEDGRKVACDSLRYGKLIERKA